MGANHSFFMNPGLLALGIATNAFEEVRASALGYSKNSRDITKYQSTRFNFAEMENQIQAAYALATSIINRIGASDEVKPEEFLRVKLIASETAVDIASKALRMAGGRGFHCDWPFERHLREAFSSVAMGPANEIIKEKLANALFDQPFVVDKTKQLLVNQ